MFQVQLYFVVNLLRVFLVWLPNFFEPFDTVLVDPVITGVIIHVLFHICCIIIVIFLFLLFVIGHYVLTEHINKQVPNLIMINLTLYAPCIILQYVYEPTRCTKFL